MAIVNIPPRPGSGQASGQRTLRERTEVTTFLARYGIEYERWTPEHPVAADAPADAVLAAYAREIDTL
jgi:cupin superfamily acireductone dioxygenase involved in methionine salvage